MRLALIAICLLAVVPPALGKRLPPERPWPVPGLYCPVGKDVYAILVERPGTIGIDGLDCQSARWDGARVTARRCYANGGSQVTLDAELVVLPTGRILHDGVQFRRYTGPRPCPQ